MHNNIYEISIAVLPVFLYMFLLLKIIPKHMVHQGRVKRYLIAGMVAPVIVLMLKFMFPTLFMNDYIFQTLSLTKMLHYDYVEAALLEECIKLAAFFYVLKGRKNAAYDPPIAIIFYNMACSAGFALYENIFYMFQNGNVMERAYSAVLMHMITGVIMGFFLNKALSSKCVLIEKVSQYEIYKPKLKRVKIIAQGLLAVILFHGTYNFNFSLPDNHYTTWYMTIYLVLGIIIAKLLINEGVRLSKELRRTNLQKNYNENLR